MPRRRGIKGEVTQWDRPNWEPLVDAVGERVTGDFMWMHEVELSDGPSLQAYKHIDTRRYVHLAADGQAYSHEPSGRYVPIPAWKAFHAVFLTLHRLGGVTEGQILDSRNAVDRLCQRDSEGEERPDGDHDGDADTRIAPPAAPG
jgi:hypothetical protein